MQVRRYNWLVALFLAMGFCACAGGSGSSGFDNFPSSENAAIDQALSEQECVLFHGLSICPADTTGAATPLPSPSPAPTTTPTSVVLNPQPTASPTAARTRGGTASPTATPTATPPAHRPQTPAVDTGINDGVIPCAPVDTGSTCLFVIPFAPEGFPLGTLFRVAVRTGNPPGLWTIGSDATPNGSPSAPSFDAAVAIDAAPLQSTGAAEVQVAVLAFVNPPSTVPNAVANLGDSGADYAFVTTELRIQPGT
jgi:hypothetical protein